MNSEPTFPQSSAPKLSVKERREQAIQEAFTELKAVEIQLKRTLWLIMQTTGNLTVVLDQSKMSPLWDLKFTAVSGQPTHCRIEAGLLPEPTGAQLCKLAEKLEGTNKQIDEFRSEVGLKEHPAGYLQALLMAHMDDHAPIRWDVGSKLWKPFSP